MTMNNVYISTIKYSVIIITLLGSSAKRARRLRERLKIIDHPQSNLGALIIAATRSDQTPMPKHIINKHSKTRASILVSIIDHVRVYA
jgi:hypothetical protein